MSHRLRELYERIAAATGETRETVERMEVEERRELMVTLGLGDSEIVFAQLVAATGETMETVISMQEDEREQLVQVLGLRSTEVIQLEDDDEDDDVLVRTNHGDSIVISDEESPVRQGPSISSQGVGGGGGGVGGGGGGGGGGPPGWGECPVCEQLMPLSKLELHAMACQGIHLNGGIGLEVNPMEVLTRKGD